MDLDLLNAPILAPIAAAAPVAPFPAIGQPWPGYGGFYAGLSRGESGQPDAHLVLLDTEPTKDLTWSAAVAWAEGLGDGARLPTRFESALLYANLKDRFKTDDWYWTGTQYSESYAWSQYFNYGSQYGTGKKYAAHARAVRRFPI
jgi:hypothetical protein